MGLDVAGVEPAPPKVYDRVATHDVLRKPEALFPELRVQGLLSFDLQGEVNIPRQARGQRVEAEYPPSRL